MQFLKFQDHMGRPAYVDPRAVVGVVDSPIFGTGAEQPGASIHFNNYMILVKGSAAENAKRIEDAREGK